MQLLPLSTGPLLNRTMATISIVSIQAVDIPEQLNTSAGLPILLRIHCTSIIKVFLLSHLVLIQAGASGSKDFIALKL